MLKKIERKELFFEKGENKLSLKDWKKLGEPITWCNMYSKDNITIWYDTSYGFIRLQVDDRINDGSDFVAIGNVVVFGSTYEGTLKTFVPYIAKE